MASKILITGGGGFIGSHLVEMCVENGYTVVSFDRYNPNNNWGWLETSKYRGEFEMKLGDIRDYDSVYQAVKGCSEVFHLAAHMSVPYSFISPLAHIRTNVEGTYNILEAARQLGSIGVHLTSTSETYGSAQYIPMDEHHPSVGQSPYAASKIAADHIGISYSRSFDLPVTILRPFNTYGPRQSTRAVIPTIITQLLEVGKPITLGALWTKRDFIYVKDVCRAYLASYESKALEGKIANVAMGKSISIMKLAEKIMDLLGEKREILEEPDRFRPNRSEVLELVGDNTKIIENTNWRPTYDITSGLLETIKWYQTPENREMFNPGFYAI